MERTTTTIPRFPVKTVGRREIETELIRKSIHMLVALVPIIAYYSKTVTVFVLASGILIYSFSEYFRLSGGEVLSFPASRWPLHASGTGTFRFRACHPRIGAMIALLLYPHPAATLAIFALALGDSFSSIIGKLFGRVRIPFTGGKTLAGSLACFVVVTWVSFRLTALLRSPRPSGLWQPFSKPFPRET
jgi:dolichol kinase